MYISAKIKILTYKEIEHTFKKGERKLKEGEFKGEEVKADNGETVKVNEAELLIAQRKELVNELEVKKDQLKNKEGYSDKYAQISIKYDELERKNKEWKEHLKTTTVSGTGTSKNYTNQYNSFLKKGAGITNPYRNEGWINLVSAYHSKQWKAVGKTTFDDYSNLYEGVLYTGSGTNQKRIKLTEQEVIKLITRTIKELGKIDKTEFDKSISTAIPQTGGVAIALDFNKLDGTAVTHTDVSGWLATLQAHAKNLVEFDNKKTGRQEYSFGYEFAKEDGAGMKDTPFNKNSITAFFELLNFIHKNYNWKLHGEVKSKVLKDIPEKTELTFIPAQDAYTKGKLHELGQENYLDKSFAGNTDKSNFWYSDTPDKAVKFTIEEGIGGWTQLIKRSHSRRSTARYRRRYWRKSRKTRITRGVAKFFFEAQELVVLRDAIWARKRTRLNLSGIRRDGEVGNESIFRFTRAMRDDCRVQVGFREFNTVQRFGKRADLIDLNQNWICDAAFDTLTQELDVGDEYIVTDELSALSNFIG